ncbi:hypothetical protein AX15_005130 [Amanita polypyramis BW_CC]|nr:hypothetical protein AX15_005130 [Amanita polypyramis BW_CC]
MESLLARLSSSSSLSLKDILNQDSLQPDIVSADVSIAADGSFVETSSGPAAREIKRHFDQLYGVGPSVRSPYAITAFVNQHGKDMYRVGNRDLSAPAAAAQEAEIRLSEAHAHSKLHDPSASPPRSKRRSRMSMHHIFSPNVFSKSAAMSNSTIVSSPAHPSTPISRPQTASTMNSAHRKLRKTRSFGPGDQSVYQDQQYGYQVGLAAQPGSASSGSTFTGRAHSHSVTSADVSRLASLGTLVAGSSPFAYSSTSSTNLTSSTPSALSANGRAPPSGSSSSPSLAEASLSQSMLLQQGSLTSDRVSVSWQSPTSDMFAQVMKWGVPSSSRPSYINPSTTSFSSVATTGTTSGSHGSGGQSSNSYERSLASAGGSSQGQRDRAFVQQPFGAGVTFDSLVRRCSRINRDDSEGSASSNHSQSGRDQRPLSKDSVLTQRPTSNITSDDSETDELHYLSHLTIPHAKMLRGMQSFESTMTARQIDIESETARGTPIAAISQNPWNYDLADGHRRYHHLVGGYDDNPNLRRAPSAVLLRNLVRASAAGGGNLGDLKLLETPEMDIPANNDGGADTSTESRPTTPVPTSTSTLIVSGDTPAKSTTTDDTLLTSDQGSPHGALDDESQHAFVTHDNTEERRYENTRTHMTVPGSDSTPDSTSSVDHEIRSPLHGTEDEAGLSSRYTTTPDVFDVLQTYTGLPLLDRLPTRSGKRSGASSRRPSDADVPEGVGAKGGMEENEDGGDDDGGDDDLMVETTVIRLSLATKEETVAPRDDPRFVIWGWVDGVAQEQKRVEDKKERQRKVRSWKGSLMSGSEGDGQSDRESNGKGPRKSRPSLGSKRRSKKDKKGKGSAVVNEFGVVTELGESVRDSQDIGAREHMDDRSVRDSASTGKKKVIIAATIERWVAQLTSEIDYDELLVFFLTYRTYVSATDLCRVLIGRFYWALRDDEDDSGGRNAKVCGERVRRFVRVRTFVAIRYWLIQFWPVDFVPNRELRLLLADYLNQLNKDPLLQRHPDGLAIVKRLIKAAKERKRAMLAKAEGQDAESSRQEQQLKSVPTSDGDDSDVDLDFLPDDQGSSSFGYGSSTPGELLGPTGVLSSGFMVGPMPVPGQGANGMHAHHPLHAEHVHHPHNQGTLSRVVRTFGNRLKRALNSRAASVSGISAPIENVANATNLDEPELSAFQMDLSGERSSASVRGSMDGYTSAGKDREDKFVVRAKQVVSRSGLSAAITVDHDQRSTAAQSQEKILPHRLPPLSLPPLSMSIPGSRPSSPQMSPAAERGRSPQRADTNSMRGEQLVKPEGPTRRSLSESRRDTIPTATAASNYDAEQERAPLTLPDKIPSTVSAGFNGRKRDIPNDVRNFKAESESEATDSGVEVDMMADVEDTVDTEAEASGRAESFRSASTSSFGVPLTTSGGPPPLFSNAKSPWPFDVVSIDDFDLSDTSSERGPSTAPGLRKPVRKLPKKPMFWSRESVSSMGIISHESMASGPSSSGMSSPTAAGLGGKIEPWQLQDLLKSLRADEEEEDGGVDAALKRLEGYIDPQKQEEKIKNVNDWIMTIQKRLETGDYSDNINDPRYSYPGYEEELIEFERVSRRESVSVDDKATSTSAPPIVGSTSTPLPSSNTVPAVPTNTPILPQTSPASCSPRVPEDAVPFEILHSRIPAFPSPSSMISSFNSPPPPRLRQSFVVSYRAEVLAQYFAMIDSELFTCIKFEELVSSGWIACQELNILDWNQYLRDRARWKAEQRFPERTNTVAVVRARFNLMTNFVISEVILAPPSTRVLVFKKFLTIAYKSYLMNNFHALTAIVTGLSNELVYKALGRYRSRIGRQDYRMFTDFQKGISNVGDFKIMRDMIDSIAQAKPLDDASHAASVVSGSTESKHKNDQKSAPSPSCIPFIGVYLSQLYRLSYLNDLIDPSAPNLAVEIDPSTGICCPPRYPDVFSALAPLPPFIQLEPLINVHKQRQISAVIKSLIAGQQLARRVHFDTDKKLFHKCLRLRALDINTLRRVLDKYPD